jgi:hypothetical protein
MLLPQPTQVAQPLNQRVQDFSFDTGKIANDDVALSLVLQDMGRSERYVMARLWITEWRIAKAIYEAPVKQDFWRDTLVPRASNSYPLCAQHIRAILDQTMPALFPENPPFEIDPNEGTPRQVARGWESIIAYQFHRAGVKSQVRLIAKDGLIFGTGIGQWGWEWSTRKRTVYTRSVKPTKITTATGKTIFINTAESDELDETVMEEKISQPFFRHREVNHVMVSPGLREPDIRKASYVVYRDYMTIRDIRNLREFEGYNIPSDEELKQLAVPPEEQATSATLENEATAFPAQGHRPLPRYIDESNDPLEHKLEVLEYWSNERQIVVLQRKKILRNDDNPYGMIPFLNCFWDDLSGTFYAFGIPRRLGGMQTHIQGLRNLRLDDINLNLQNVWLEKQGTNLTGQPYKMYPGARFKVSDPDGIKPLIKQPVLSEAWQEEGVLVADAEKTSGANEMMVQGAMPAGGRTSMGRTATGAGILGGASSSRIESYVGVIADQVMVPLLYAFLHMDRLWLEPKVMRKVIGQTLWNSMEAEHDGDLLVDMCNNSDMEFQMVAGSSISARRAMGQMLPLEMQMFSTPSFQQGLMDAGFKVNWVEFGRRAEQATGWRSQEDIFQPLTPDDVKKRMSMSPEIVKAQTTQARIAQLHQQKSQLSAQEHQQKLQEIDAKGLAASGQEIITRAIERAATRDEIPEISGSFGGQ